MAAEPNHKPEAEHRRVEELNNRREQLLRQLHEVEEELTRLNPVRQRRAESIRRFRHTIQRIGDVESPIHEQWDAER